MRKPRFDVRLFSVSVIFLSAGVAWGQDFPNKPIRIVTAPAGSSADFTARQIAAGVAASLGQQVIVDNRPSGVVPADYVAKAAPDGHTLLLSGGNLWIGPLFQNVPYDPVRDFAPVTLATSSPNVVVVHPSLPVKSIKELVSLAKARPGQLNYSSSGAAGGAAHLAVELFNSMAGVKIVRIPYKSGSMETADLIAGQVQLTFATPSSVMPLVESGRLRALAITSLQPSTLVPGLPTVADSGVPGYESGVSFGIFAPAKTSPMIINRLNREIVRVLNQTEVKEKFFNVGLETFGTSPERLTVRIKSEMDKMGKVIKDAGIRTD